MGCEVYMRILLWRWKILIDCALIDSIVIIAQQIELINMLCGELIKEDDV